MSTAQRAAIFCLLASICVLYTVHHPLSAAPSLVRSEPQGHSWNDLAGHAYSDAEFSSRRATVFVFFSMQCPISNQYIPRVLEMAKVFALRDVQFFLVNSNVEDRRPALDNFAAARSISVPVVKDKGTTLADWLGATVTPEAVVVDPTGTIRYRGRIDDNVVRERAIRHELRSAIEAVLDNRPVERPRAVGLGCAIFHEPAYAFPSHNIYATTYYQKVARILNEKCVPCHRPGNVAPFSLQTYREAAVWAAQIKEYTARRVMPPWKAVEGYGSFDEQPHISEADIRTLAEWAEQGAPAGNPADAVSAPAFPPAEAWVLGTPDLILRSANPYHLAAEGEDVYRNFVLPKVFQKDQLVSAIEFKPDNRRIVHHMVAFIQPPGPIDPRDGRDGEPGYSASGADVLTLFPHWMDVWIPGNGPRRLPKGVAYTIPAGSRLVLQVHYHKSGAKETDQSAIALYFARERVQRIPRIWPVGKTHFKLKPGEAGQEVKGEIRTPDDVHVLSIFPHMHQLGTEMKVTATLPSGDARPLIWVRDWDFNWQATYHYRTPLALPKGSKVEVVSTYDNTAANPRQMNDPPKMVRFGIQTTDEMCFAFMMVTLDHEELSPPSAPKADKRVSSR